MVSACWGSLPSQIPVGKTAQLAAVGTTMWQHINGGGE